MIEFETLLSHSVAGIRSGAGTIDCRFRSSFAKSSR